MPPRNQHGFQLPASQTQPGYTAPILPAGPFRPRVPFNQVGQVYREPAAPSGSPTATYERLVAQQHSLVSSGVRAAAATASAIRGRAQNIASAKTAAVHSQFRESFKNIKAKYPRLTKDVNIQIRKDRFFRKLYPVDSAAAVADQQGSMPSSGGKPTLYFNGETRGGSNPAMNAFVVGHETGHAIEAKLVNPTRAAQFTRAIGSTPGPSRDPWGLNRVAGQGSAAQAHGAGSDNETYANAVSQAFGYTPRQRSEMLAPQQISYLQSIGILPPTKRPKVGY